VHRPDQAGNEFGVVWPALAMTARATRPAIKSTGNSGFNGRRRWPISASVRLSLQNGLHRGISELMELYRGQIGGCGADRDNRTRKIFDPRGVAIAPPG
jgi:hypothetical protein